eukprot:23565-Eustigmatos_ZCMA.PRE.1
MHVDQAHRSVACEAPTRQKWTMVSQRCSTSSPRVSRVKTQCNANRQKLCMCTWLLTGLPRLCRTLPEQHI